LGGNYMSVRLCALKLKKPKNSKTFPPKKPRLFPVLVRSD